MKQTTPNPRQVGSNQKPNKKNFMVTEEILPHMYSAVNLLEIQIQEISTSKKQIKVELCSIETFVSILQKMKLAAHSLQISIASKNTLESYRQVQIFYGLLRMIRPTLFGMLGMEEQEETDREALQ